MELDNWGEIVSFFWPIIKYCSEIHIQVWKCKFVCNICRCSHKSMVAVLESHFFKMHLDPFAVRVPNTKACKCLILHLNLKKKSKRDKRGALSWSCLVISWSFNVLPAWSSRETKKNTKTNKSSCCKDYSKNIVRACASRWITASGPKSGGKTTIFVGFELHSERIGPHPQPL